MLLIAATTPVWATLTAGIGAGAGGSLLGIWQGRRLVPAQKAELEASAAQIAVDTVESALKIARERIDALERQVVTLTEKIGALRADLEHATADREQIVMSLNLALSERARLQQQIADLNRRTGAKRVADMIDAELSSPDAIIMIDLQTGDITYANEGVFGLLGYVPTTLVGRSIEDLVPEEARKSHEHLREMFARNPEQREMGSGLQLLARTQDGRSIPVDISLHPTGDGRVIALMKRRHE